MTENNKTKTPTINTQPKAGLNSLFKTTGENINEYDILVNLDDIEVKAQIREEFEDEYGSLALLGKSLRKKQLQPIVLRVNDLRAEKPYLLVIGERRYRGARIEGLSQLRARVMELSEEEAEDAQFAENVHRKNFTLIEEAKKIKKDLADANGNIEAVLEKHLKGRPWLSKMLALLDLPTEAKRLVTENISADVELINSVKTIEKIDPAKAKALVDDLKATRGKEEARPKVAKAKEEVKPSKKPKPEYKQTDIEGDASDGQPVTPKWLVEQRKKDAEREAASKGENAATPRDRSFEEPSEVEVFAGAKSEFVPTVGKIAIDLILDKAFESAQAGLDVQKIIETMGNQRDDINEHLLTHYNAGKNVLDISRAVLIGFRVQKFSTTGAGALALSAFLYGSDIDATFSMVDIIGSVKNI